MVRIYSPTKRFTRNKPNFIFITSTCHLFIAIQFFIQKMFAHKIEQTHSLKFIKKKIKMIKVISNVYKGVMRKFNF